jgi:organic hydroperoxide reductase OsmC/OhrA
MHSYLFETQTEWKGDRQAATRGLLTPELQVSAPVEFQGQAGFWTPEFLLVAAAEVCLMETFLGTCEWSHLKITSYRSSAQGKLEKVEGALRFIEITIRPQVQIETEEQRAIAEHVMEKAKKGCLIANSLRTPVIVEPVFQVL